MKHCYQTESQNVFQHGLSVFSHYSKLLNSQWDSFRIPEWLTKYKDEILKSQHPFKTVKHATIFHDIGKPFCLTVDDIGRRHFPNHEVESERKWLELFPQRTTEARLIRDDMLFHTKKYDELYALRLSTQDICTHLLIALAELHSNAALFGGRTDSDGFKIKWKRLDKLGGKFCEELFNHSYIYVIVRKDLSPAQKAVQSAHACIESARHFLTKDEEHPSVIICEVKSENKLKMIMEELKGKVDYKTFREADMNDEYTALATAPIYNETRKLFSRFQLIT